jgi:hypothetical protein
MAPPIAPRKVPDSSFVHDITLKTIIDTIVNFAKCFELNMYYPKTWAIDIF